MGELLQLKLEDFIPSYAHFGDDYQEEEFDIYGDEPENVFYKKKEFYKNRLEATEERPPGPGIPLKTQHNLSRFLSTRTLNDEMLVFAGVGSGKCVAPDTLIQVNSSSSRIEDIWKANVGYITNDGVGDWTIPTSPLIVNCINKERDIIQRRVKHLYRQHVNENLYKVTLDNNIQITATGIHKILLKSGKWTKTSDITTDSLVATTDDLNTIVYNQVLSIETIPYTGYVYDFEVEEYHNYIANGIVTHNTCTAVTISELSRAINPYLKPTLVLVKGGTLRRNFIQELAMKCTKGQYIPANYESLSDREKVVRMNKLISRSYEIHTFETFCTNIIDKASDNYLKREYSNRVVIIDEAHNIHIQPKKAKKTVDIYGSIHRFLHLLENRKIALLTATPMRDQPNEFGSLMNLILPLDKQLPTGKEFNKMFFGKDKLQNDDELRRAIRGRVSYVRSMESSIKKYFEGEIYKSMKKIRIYPSKMSETQTKGYVNAYNADGGEAVDIEEITEEDDDGEGKGLYTKSRQASLFVFPDGSYGTEGFNKYVDQKGSNYSLIQSFKDILTNNGKAIQQQIIDNIRKYSSIYAATIEEIYKHPDENVFVYNKYVHGSGAILFGELLKLVGFERTRGHIDLKDEDEESLEDIIDLGDIGIEGIPTEEKIPDTSEKEAIEERKKFEEKPRTSRFAIITRETVSDVEVDRILSKFNAPSNKTGKYVQVIIGSQIIGEGKSLRNVRQIHIQTPHWNNSETEQAIGRGIRAFSLDDFKLSERYTKVFRHASIPKKGIQSINYRMYKVSEDKDFKIKQI